MLFRVYKVMFYAMLLWTTIPRCVFSFLLHSAERYCENGPANKGCPEYNSFPLDFHTMHVRGRSLAVILTLETPWALSRTFNCRKTSCRCLDQISRSKCQGLAYACNLVIRRATNIHMTSHTLHFSNRCLHNTKAAWTKEDNTCTVQSACFVVRD